MPSHLNILITLQASHCILLVAKYMHKLFVSAALKFIEFSEGNIGLISNRVTSFTKRKLYFI